MGSEQAAFERAGSEVGSRPEPHTVRALRGVYAPSTFSYVDRFSMVLLYGRAGRLNTKKRRFPAGQVGDGEELGFRPAAARAPDLRAEYERQGRLRAAHRAGR